MASRVRIQAAGALCAVALAGAAVADATTKTDGGVVDGETRKFTAKCPKGERVDVGGFKSTVDGDSGILIEDLFFKGTRKWRATFDGLGDAASASAIAYCADTPRLDKRTATAATPPAPPRTRGGGEILLKATAKCRPGTTVQLGGFAVDDSGTELSPRGLGAPQGIEIASMKAAGGGTKWKVKGLAENGVELTAVAGCADQPAPKAVKQTEAIVPGQATFAKAKCDRGDEVAMAGFKQSLGDGSGPYIRTLKRSGSRAVKAGTWEFANPELKLTAIAYCG